MKQYLLCLMAFIYLWSCNQKTDMAASIPSDTLFNESAELDSIMKTIESETTCFFKRDYECWKNYWINESYAFQAWSNENGTFDASANFDTIAQNVKKYIETYPLIKGQSASHPEVIRKNILTKFYHNDICHIIWDQYNYTESIKGYNHSKEVSISAFWDYKNIIKEKANIH